MISEKGKYSHRKRKQRRETARRERNILLLLVLTVTIATAGIAVTVVWGFPASVQTGNDMMPDKRAVDGRLRAREGNGVEDGQYRIVMNQLPTMTEGSRECNIEFENPHENQYSSRISLYETSDGACIGGTKRVEPGKYVETIELDRTLEAGEYPVLAKIELFEELEPAGELKLEITLRVIKE